MTALVDHCDFCRTCDGGRWLDDGQRCDMCGGSGNKSIIILPASPAPMLYGPELRDWQRSNPRCFDCGADEDLTEVRKAYHPVPATHLCTICMRGRG